ncbi:uncharacterized protein LOC142590505 isoform X3 [Dermacentor variabilis]|uniref:uncharacterized protein LOC142590505 isoform X3 n=1 Tax=Dermacentor variabilis TaxID=34621 RepID=UPI003F5C565B
MVSEQVNKQTSLVLSLGGTFKASADADISCAHQDLAYLCIVDNNSPQVLIPAGWLSPGSGLTNAMSLAESITAKTACHGPSKVAGQVEVGMQCSLPLADKSVGCSLKAGSESKSVQTVDRLCSTSGLTNATSLAESITAKTACHGPFKVAGQVEVGMQCSLPLADKSVGCSLKAGSQSRSVQTVASRPSISPSTAKYDNSKQGCLHRCHLCDYAAEELFHLEAHASIHTGEKPFQCPSCHRSFSSRSNLNVHLRTHTGEKPFECPSCSRRFAQQATLKSHMLTHTGEKPYQCPSCCWSFSHKGYLKAHLLTHTGEKPYQCPSCSRGFSNRYDLKVHLRTHTGEKPFECPSCPQSFSRKGHLKNHLRTHTGEKPFQCPSCSQSFSQQAHLKGHLRTHTGEKPYQCPSCSQSFSHKCNLNVHLHTHTGEKPYQCPTCSQSFLYKGHLKVHLRTHTGEKPYQCPSCSQSFSQKGNLRKHEERSHLNALYAFRDSR